MAKVLIIDDDQELRAIIRFFLEQNNHIVAEAENGDETLEKLAAEKYDLLVLDLLMPIQDGFTTLRRLRQNKDTASIPVVVLSSLADQASITRALKLGARDVIKKPFSPEELYLRIARHLDVESSEIA